MNIQTLHIGISVHHPRCGLGTAKTLSESTAEILFGGGKHTVEPEAANLGPAEPQAPVTGLSLPLTRFIEQTVKAAIDKLGLTKPDLFVQRPGARWHGGKAVLHPADTTLQTKEVPLEVFFRKIVMVFC